MTEGEREGRGDTEGEKESVGEAVPPILGVVVTVTVEVNEINPEGTAVKEKELEGEGDLDVEEQPETDLDRDGEGEVEEEPLFFCEALLLPVAVPPTRVLLTVLLLVTEPYGAVGVPHCEELAEAVREAVTEFDRVPDTVGLAEITTVAELSIEAEVEGHGDTDKLPLLVNVGVNEPVGLLVRPPELLTLGQPLLVALAVGQTVGVLEFKLLLLTAGVQVGEEEELLLAELVTVVDCVNVKFAVAVPPK